MTHRKSHKATKVSLTQATSYTPPPIEPPFSDIETKLVIPYLKVCYACRRPAKLLCARCRCVFYCSKTCQVADWTHAHQESCSIIRKKAAICDADEADLAKAKKVLDTTTKPGSAHAGALRLYEKHCERTSGSHEILTSRIVTLLPCKQAIRQGIMNDVRSLRLNPTKPFYLPDVKTDLTNLLMDLFMRIQQDKFAYEYLRWFVYHYLRVNPDKGNKNLMIVHPTDRSILWTDYQLQTMPLFAFVIYTLLQVRLYLTAVRMLCMFTFLTAIAVKAKDKTPNALLFQRLAGHIDVLRHIRGYVIDELQFMPWTANHFTIRSPDILYHQVVKLFQMGTMKNERTWKALLHPEPLLEQPVPIYLDDSDGTAVEAYFLVDGYRKSWKMWNPDCARILLIWLLQYEEHVNLGDASGYYSDRLLEYDAVFVE